MEDNQTQSQGVTEGQDVSQTEITPSVEDTIRSRMEAGSETSNEPAQENGESQTTTEDSSIDDTTDKGTQVAKEPESQYYQKLKNETADMRRILNDPVLLKEHLRSLEGTEVSVTNANDKGKESENDEIAKIVEQCVDKNTGEIDIKKLLFLQEERATKKIQEAVQSATKDQFSFYERSKTYQSELGSVRTSHPELDPNNKESFSPEIDQLVGERFIAQGGYEGKISLKQVVDKTFEDIAKWQEAGRKKAEVEIVRKNVGAINQSKVSGKTNTNDEEGMSPEQVIANRMSKSIRR